MSEDVFDVDSTPEFTTFKGANGRAITAAAQVLSGPRIRRMTRKVNGKGMPWQTASWEYYDEIPEYSWAVELLATHVSKARLVAAQDMPGSDEPMILDGDEYEVNGETFTPTKIQQDAAALVAGFAGGSNGQQQLLYRAAVQLIVAAETYIVGRQIPDSDPQWDAYSNEEIMTANGRWMVNDGTEKYELGDNDILIRVWRPHPRKRSEPRSSSRPLLPVLAEIKGLTQAIGARIDSRLAGAGVLFIPESLAMMTSSNAELEEGEDPFVAELLDSMLTPIRDRDSAAAVVPIVVRVPDDAVDKIKHVRFEIESKTDEAAARLDAVTRLARGVDLPLEQILGMGSLNHWGVWAATEDTIKGPVATLDSILVHALTIGYVRPGLQALGHSEDDITDLLAWYDLTALIQRPDRSAQAVEVFDRDGLGFAALRRETGMDESDAPTDEDTCRKTMLGLIRSDPANASVWIKAFGPCSGLDLPPLTDIFGDGTAMIPQQNETPAVQRAPENNRDLPELQAAVGNCPDNVECLYSTCEYAVLRALELAGKRMRGSSPRNERSGLLTIPAHELHANVIVASQLPTHGLDKLMEGAWTGLHIALPFREALVADLDGYVRSLIERRELHDPARLRPIVERHA